tara:strand:- start:76 stop:495 length:420 start_codon:yes stop_codon:yes gene_type:complete
MLKLTKREIFKLNKNLKIDNLLNRIAEGFVQSFDDGIAISRDINNKKFAPLKPATIKKKGHKRPLDDQGKMKKVYVKKKATKSSKKATISMNRRDREVPSIVHNQGLGFQKKREWFGVGKVQKAIGKEEARIHIRRALK